MICVLQLIEAGIQGIDLVYILCRGGCTADCMYDPVAGVVPLDAVSRVDSDSDVISRHLQTPMHGRRSGHCKAKQTWYLFRSNKQKRIPPPLLDADYPRQISPKTRWK